MRAAIIVPTLGTDIYPKIYENLKKKKRLRRSRKKVNEIVFQTEKMLRKCTNILHTFYPTFKKVSGFYKSMSLRTSQARHVREAYLFLHKIV